MLEVLVTNQHLPTTGGAAPEEVNEIDSRHVPLHSGLRCNIVLWEISRQYLCAAANRLLCVAPSATAPSELYPEIHDVLTDQLLMVI